MSSRVKKSEPMSNVDAAWFHMESSTNMAMITGLMIFDRPLDYRRVVATYDARMACFDRFRQRVRESNFSVGLPRWEIDPHFSIYSHVHRIALPDPGDQAELQNLVGDLMSTPLDFCKPLWQVHLVENLKLPEGQGSALVMRLHHCIADGLALMQVLLSMTDGDPDAPWPAERDRSKPAWNPIRWALGPAIGAYKLVSGARNAAGKVLHDGLDTLAHPKRVLDVARLGLDMARVGADGTRSLAKLLFILPDRKTIFKGQCQVEKRAAWSNALKLDDVKAVGQTMGGTVNDVLLSAVSGALRRYLESREQPTNDVEIRAVVPVSLRAADEFDQLGNRFGLVFLTLPVGVRDPLRRLRILKRRMDEIKNSTEAVVAFGILQAIGLTPIQIENIIVKIFALKGTAVMTNVPGPQKTLYFAGEALRTIMFWVPAPGNLGMGVSILSYNGQVILGVATDQCLVPDPETIVEAFHEEFEYFKRWGRPRREIIAEPADEPGTAGETVQHATGKEKLEPGDGSQQALRIGTDEPESPGQLAPASIATDGHCQAKTRAGNPCKNRASPGLNYCRVHTPAGGNP